MRGKVGIQCCGNCWWFSRYIRDHAWMGDCEVKGKPVREDSKCDSYLLKYASKVKAGLTGEVSKYSRKT